MHEESYLSVSFEGLIKILKKEKWIFLLTILFFIGLGIGIALFLKDEFTSTGKILPEVSGSSKMKGLAGLANIAGVDLSAEGTEAIRPDLYPNVLQSVPFFQYLMEKKVKTSDGKTITVRQYAIDSHFEGDTIIKKQMPIIDLNDGSIRLSMLDFKLINEFFLKRVEAVMDKKTGVISIASKMQDRYVATAISSIALNYLTNYITEYRTQKAKDNVLFFEEQMKRAKSRFYNTQAQKAQYQDSFQQQYMRQQSVDLQRDRIETEYQFSSIFYKQLEQQYEQSKIELQRDKPVIKILEPPIVPNLKSEPKRALIVLGITFLGTILGIIIALLRKRNYKEVFIASTSSATGYKV